MEIKITVGKISKLVDKMKQFAGLLLALAVLLVPTPSAACPVGCSCIDHTVDCTDAGLDQVPDDIPLDVEILILKTNLIETLGDNVFENLTSLVNLDISNNNLHTLSDMAFNSLFLLNELTLGHNNLEDLPEGVFATCYSLEKLYLEHNRLTFSVFEAFKESLPLLIILDLSSNPLVELPYLMLQGKEMLNFLVLHDALIETIDVNAFVSLSRLIFLNLASNNIKDLKRETFQHLREINTIDLSNNQLVCSCDTKKFQDWLEETPVEDILDPNVSCEDPLSGDDIDIEEGALDHLCFENATTTTPRPTFPPPGDCSQDASLELDVVDITDEGATIVWEYEEIEEGNEIILECRIFKEDVFYEDTITVSEGEATLTGLRAETDYVCCGLVYSCGVYACKDFDTGVKLPEDCPDVGLVVGLTLAAVVLSALVVSMIALLIYCIKTRFSSDSTAKSEPPYAPASESHLIAMSSRTSSSTGFDSNKPPPPPDPRPPPMRVYSGAYDEIGPYEQYEVIPADQEDKGQNTQGFFRNPGYLHKSQDIINQVGQELDESRQRANTAPSSSKNKVNTGNSAMDPKRLTAGQYLHTNSPSTKKPRRFTKPNPVEEQPLTVVPASDRNSSKSESAADVVNNVSIHQPPLSKTGVSQSNPNLLESSVVDGKHQDPVTGRQSDPFPLQHRDSSSNHVGGEKEYLPPESLTLPPKKTETLQKAHEMGIGVDHHHLTTAEQLPEASRV